MTLATPHFVLILSCPNRPGIVAAVSAFPVERNASITEAKQFNDALTQRFYMSVVFCAAGSAHAGLEALQEQFAPIATTLNMTWRMHDASRRPSVLIAVSKLGHCLHDLLYRWRSGLLPVQIAAVMSNHDDMRSSSRRASAWITSTRRSAFRNSAAIWNASCAGKTP
jgi:formyltetrahydrofolate deformylase